MGTLLRFGYGIFQHRDKSATAHYNCVEMDRQIIVTCNALQPSNKRLLTLALYRYEESCSLLDRGPHELADMWHRSKFTGQILFH
jgi:hypothetical protein